METQLSNNFRRGIFLHFNKLQYFHCRELNTISFLYPKLPVVGRYMRVGANLTSYWSGDIIVFSVS